MSDIKKNNEVVYGFFMYLIVFRGLFWIGGIDLFSRIPANGWSTFTSLIAAILLCAAIYGNKK